MRLAVSACLLGEPVRYDGGSKPCAEVIELTKKNQVCPVCPERAAGLSCPRPPAEQVGERVLLKDGTDVTRAFADGARAECAAAQRAEVPLAVLKAKSPSCGVGLVYDGTYTGTLTAGMGVCARLLAKEGICVVTEDTVKNVKPSVEHPVAIERFPGDATPIEGHTFEALVGTVDDVPVVVYPGRIHLYQGYSAAEVTALVRHAHHLGCRDIIFACATGCVPGNAHKGLGILTDQINLTGRNPLAEWAELRDVDTPFVDMNDAYSPYLRTIARGVADDLGISVEEGVYAGMLGPCFETPAETAMLRTLGVSYVGMSTVCEVIMAKALEMNVLGLTLAANEAGAPGVDHQSVVAEAEKHADDFERLVRGVLRLL